MNVAAARTTSTPSKVEASAIYKQAINALEIGAEHASQLSNHMKDAISIRTEKNQTSEKESSWSGKSSL
jgi:hypothetical protein